MLWPSRLTTRSVPPCRANPNANRAAAHSAKTPNEILAERIAPPPLIILRAAPATRPARRGDRRVRIVGLMLLRRRALRRTRAGQRPVGRGATRAGAKGRSPPGGGLLNEGRWGRGRGWRAKEPPPPFGRASER